MQDIVNKVGVIVAVFLSALVTAISAPECDFFKVEGGYLESVGDFGGDLKCSSYPSIHAAKKECLSMVACDGFSFGPWGSGVGGCLKMNRKGGFTTNPEYVGYHKTLMGCCGDDKLEKAQCHEREGRHPKKPVPGGKRIEKLVSRGKPTMQSTVWYHPKQAPKGAPSSRAVDGDKNPKWSGNSCTHTLETPNPWWSVDLLDDFDVSRVDIVGIDDDCCWKRLSNFVISVGDNPFPRSNPACLIGGTIGKGETKSYPCALRGRFVTITIVKPKEILNLCEVEVYAMVKEKKSTSFE